MSNIEKHVENFKAFSPAIVDAYFIVDRNKTIVDFNRVFYSLLPRSAARKLKGSLYTDVVNYQISTCIAEQVWEQNRHVRLDEISGTIASDPDGKAMKFILSAIPLLENGEAVGAVILQRDVTVEAEVQVKYQEMLEKEAKERERLAVQVKVRTKELLETNQLLLKTQRELLDYKRGLLL